MKMVKNKKLSFLVVGNWKMNPSSLNEAKDIFLAVKKSARRWPRTEVVIAPPHPFLSSLSSYSFPNNISLGAQDCSFNLSGSFTGEVSPVTLESLGITRVILGHSERRHQGETDELVAQKVLAAVSSGLSPVVCVGESVRDGNGEFLSFLEKQVMASVRLLNESQLSKISIAYEPIWAIGRSDNKALSGDGLYEMVIFIRRALSKRFGRKVALAVPVLYGGSVTADNVVDVLAGQVQGLLVGRASLEVESFKTIADAVEKMVR